MNVQLNNSHDCAFVNGLTLAMTRMQALKNFKSVLKGWGFKFKRVENMEKYDQRIKKFKVAKSIQQLAKKVIKTGNSNTRFDVFYPYTKKGKKF